MHFYLPDLYLTLPLEVTSEFHHELWREKTRVSELPSGIYGMTIGYGRPME